MDFRNADIIVVGTNRGGYQLVRQPLVYIIDCLDGMGTYEQSAWVRDGRGGVKQKSPSGKRNQEQFHDLRDWMSATDSRGRDYVSNVCAVLGGLGDKDVIAEAIEDLGTHGLLVGVSIQVDKRVDRDEGTGPQGDRRFSIGHPCFAQFKEQRGLSAAMEHYGCTSQREDAGGIRTVKFEYSKWEMNLAKEGREGPNTLYRISCGEGWGFPEQPCYYGAQGNIFGTPAESCLINLGKRPRAFTHGTCGSESWSDANPR